MSASVRSQLSRAAATAGFAALVAVIGLGAVPASAHENLVRAVPRDGSTVVSAPSRVELVFDEKAGKPANILVTGPSGERVNQGPVRVADNTVSVRVDVHAAGVYRLAYRVVSADGHPVSGQSTFRFAPAGTAEPSSAGPSAEARDEQAEPAAQAKRGSGDDPAAGGGVDRGPVIGVVAGAALLAGLGLLTVRRRPGGTVRSGNNQARKNGS